MHSVKENGSLFKTTPSAAVSVNEIALKLQKQKRPTLPITSKKLRIVDLFAGCGGLTLGALQAANELSLDLEVAFAIDACKPALDVYRSNFSDVTNNIHLGDIKDFFADETFSKLNKIGQSLIKEMGKVHVLLAGPPCQGNSDLNNSSRRNDPRNDLYLAPMRFAEKLRPDLVVIENVPGVIHGDTNVVQRTVARLQRVGYACTEIRTDLTAFGLPQTRKRHLLVASQLHSHKKLRDLLFTIPTGTRNVHLWDFISDLEDAATVSKSAFTSAARISETNLKRINYLFENDLYDLPNKLRPPCHREKAHSYVSMYGRLRRDAPAQTITSGFGSMGQGRYVHPTRLRTITPHEAARIQGFPDYFKFGDEVAVTELRKMIGNAVAPELSLTIIRKLLE